MRHFLNELKRREVIKPLVAYAGLSWLILQVVGVLASIVTMHPLLAPGILLFLVCGLPVAAYLSWHFDFSFEGITRTPGFNEEENAAIEPFGPRSWIGLLSIILFSSFIGFQYFSSIKDEQLATQEGLNTVQRADSIAVMPFVDQSPEQDQLYLALGLSEEITSLLGRSEGFKVMASRSSQILAEKGITPVDIGRRLKVQTVLTGSVRVTGSRLKVRVELLDTENGHTLWTESFLRELKDIFEIESEIGRAVVNLLQDKYVEAGSFRSLAATSSTDAYVMYLKGREEYRKQTTESMKAARKLFEQSLALDPEYAKAYVALADTLVLLSEQEGGFGVLNVDIAADLAGKNLEKALVRQPDIAEIYAVMGVVKLLRGEFDDSLGALDKAIQLNPSLAIAYTWKSYSLKELQRFDESFLALEKAQALDPLFQTNTYNLGFQLTSRGRFKEAEAIFKQLKVDFPDSTFSYQGLADLYFNQGDFVGAIREAQKATKISPDNQDLAYKMLGPLSQLGLTKVIQGLTTDPFWDATILIFEQKYEALFEKMDFEVAANPDDYWVAFEAGWYHAMFGEKEQALRLLTERESTLSQADKFYMPFCSPAIEISWANKELGNDKYSQELIAQCWSLTVQQNKSSITSSYLDYLSARIYALQGKPTEAIEALSEAINKGWREWWTKHDPLLKSLKEEPEFQSLVQFIDEDLSRQKTAAAALFVEE